MMNEGRHIAEQRMIAEAQALGANAKSTVYGNPELFSRQSQQLVDAETAVRVLNDKDEEIGIRDYTAADNVTTIKQSAGYSTDEPKETIDILSQVNLDSDDQDLGLNFSDNEDAYQSAIDTIDGDEEDDGLGDLFANFSDSAFGDDKDND